MHHNLPRLPPLRAARSGAPPGLHLEGHGQGDAVLGRRPRGNLFVSPQDAVYEGQIVGEHGRDNDMVVTWTRTEAADQHARLGSDKGPPR